MNNPRIPFWIMAALGVLIVGLSFGRKREHSELMSTATKSRPRVKAERQPKPGVRRMAKTAPAHYVPQPVKYEFGPADREMYEFADALESEK